MEHAQELGLIKQCKLKVANRLNFHCLIKYVGMVIKTEVQDLMKTVYKGWQGSKAAIQVPDFSNFQHDNIFSCQIGQSI